MLWKIYYKIIITNKFFFLLKGPSSQISSDSDNKLYIVSNAWEKDHFLHLVF